MNQFVKTKILAPIYIFQMGKVGSTSLRSTLYQETKRFIVSTHGYHLMESKHQTLLKWRKCLRLPIYVISPIRDPLSRNVSAFFQNFRRYTGYEFSDQNWMTDELRTMFLTHYPHNQCLEWLDKNLRPTFGIDVFSTPFSTDQKWQTYQNGMIKLLVYRTDLDRSKQLKVISQFLGQDINEWIYRNVAEDKDYSDAYKTLQQSANLPDIYISFMCKSRYCRHFWATDEIEAFAKRWGIKQSLSNIEYSNAL